MKDYQFNHYERFIADNQFREWVFNPTPESDRLWEEWFAGNPDKKEAALHARAILLDIREGEETLSRRSKNKMWSVIERATEAVNREKVIGKTSRTLPLNPGYKKRPAAGIAKLVKIAAVVSLLILSVWFIYSQAVQERPMTASCVTVKFNPPGQRSILNLPDGSTVTLGADSELSYEEGFQGKQREVWLKGEAFFKVAENHQRPFKVHSGDLTTTALGTSFNVRSYPASNQIAVSLVTGKVRVTSPAAKGLEVYLAPGDQARYYKAEKEIHTESFNVHSVTGWKEGILIFEEATNQEVFHTLRLWYGVQFVFENEPVTTWSYTGEFSTESLENVLKGLRFIHGFSYDISGKTITIQYANNKREAHEK